MFSLRAQWNRGVLSRSEAKFRLEESTGSLMRTNSSSPHVWISGPSDPFTVRATHIYNLAVKRMVRIVALLYLYLYLYYLYFFFFFKKYFFILDKQIDAIFAGYQQDRSSCAASEVAAWMGGGPRATGRIWQCAVLSYKTTPTHQNNQHTQFWT